MLLIYRLRCADFPRRTAFGTAQLLPTTGHTHANDVHRRLPARADGDHGGARGATQDAHLQRHSNELHAGGNRTRASKTRPGPRGLVQSRPETSYR
jgi:hypothetical protein